jgi:glycosyltransferase involved in cell wall biosynthesis
VQICLVSQEYPPETAWGGIGSQTRNKAVALTRLGHTVHVLSRAADAAGPELRTETEDGVIVHRMQPPGHDFPIYGRSAYMLGYSWLVLARLQRLAETTTFDVVDFPEFGGEGFAYQLDRTMWNWLPVVVNVHGPLAMFVDYFDWPERGSRFHRFGTFIEEFSIQRADGVIAVSASIADLVSRVYNYPRERIDVVHNSVDTDLFRPSANGRPYADRATVLFVGNVIENKGIDTVLEATLRLRGKYPDIRLQIIGKPDPRLVPQFRARLARDGTEAHVEFLGIVNNTELPKYYQAADVFCAPADFDGLSTVYLEAMACGCPVVASTAGGACEAVLEEETGLLVPPRDVSATAAALDRVLANRALRAHMSLASRRRVQEHFTFERYGRRMLAAYEKAIASSQQSPLRMKDERE